MDLLFRTEDYVILAVTLLFSAGSGLYVSTVKHKQSSVVEYFLAGRNVNLALVLLSYFSSFAAGGMTNIAIDTYSFGAQPLVFIFTIPLIVCFIRHLVVPVFYRLNNISMLKYFEIRFGRTVYFITLVLILLIMITIGSNNIFAASIAIHQALSVWVSASAMTIVCIIYSSLGGMRGIIVADAIQSVVMVTALLFIFTMGIIKSGGFKAIWDINKEYGRLQLLDTSFDPTVIYTFWSTLIGFSLLNLAQSVASQTLQQRYLTVSSFKSAQQLSTIGSTMIFLYIVLYQSLGLIVFAFYKGCHVVQAGAIAHINQLMSYFAMDIMHQFPFLPGIYFSGILCASLSTISSLLNSISAIVTTHVTETRPTISDKMATLLSKVLVVAFGGIMLFGLVILTSFQNIVQAGITLNSVIAGPILALYCIGIFCPQANRKATAVSLVVAMLFSLWIVIGSVVTSPVFIVSPFSNNCTDNNFNHTIRLNQKSPIGSVDAYFPLSKVSYIYSCSETFAMTIIGFILTSITTGMFKRTEEGQPVSQLTLDLIPHCVRCLQLKMSRRMRRLLLCDVYDGVNSEVQQSLVNGS